MAEQVERTRLWGMEVGRRSGIGSELLSLSPASSSAVGGGSQPGAAAAGGTPSQAASTSLVVAAAPSSSSAAAPSPAVVPVAAPVQPVTAPASPSSSPFVSVQPAPPSALDAPALYVNRELSWLEFNARVLSEAEDPSVPLYERIKFLSIVTGNLDEFFMVRVAGLKQQLSGEVEEAPPDGMIPQEQLAALSTRTHKLVDAQYRCWNESLVPALTRERVMLVKPADLSPDELASLDASFKNDIFPVLTPIAIDPGHPFPHLRNKSLNLGVMFARENDALDPGFGVVQVPSMLPRIIPVKYAGARSAFVLLEDLIARHVHEIFPVLRLRGTYAFRVTRNWDLEIDEEEAEDLLQTIQQELRRRDRGNAVRLEISGEVLPGSLARLCKALKLDPEDVYLVNGPLNFADLARVVVRDERRELRDEPFSPQIFPQLRASDDLFAMIREKDMLLHHPYESFDAVVEFISRAADDPQVLAIKQTLYRTSGDSPIIKALGRAAENGKQVTAIVELKARFDEESNIQWARTLEQAGVHVVYGLLGLKTHAKAALVVRREKDKLRRYVHLSTGNYHPATARLYTDLSLFTAREQIGEDVTAFFNLLTGYSAPSKWNALVVAPLGLHEAVLGLIRREAEHAKAGRPAGIVAKFNAVVDRDVIEALYRAAQAGVPITLLVRGICGLRPDVPGVSERIKVRALVDRFLEHSRIAWFKNGGQDEVFISSADWMPRNFHRRVEIMIPIIDPDIRSRLINEVLAISSADNAKSWALGSDGSYTRLVPPPGEALVRAQSRFIELARERVKEAEANIRSSGRYQFVQVYPVSKTTMPEERRRRQQSGQRSSKRRT